MENIIIHKNVELKDPVMIAGWPGMGNVALGVVDYLRKKMGVTKFAEIQMDPFAGIDSVVVENGVARLQDPPKNTFYYMRSPDIIIFEGEAQLVGPNGASLLNKVLDLAVNLKTSRIYTGAAFPLPISHRERPEVYGAVNKKELENISPKFGIEPMDSGHISGLNGLMLGFAYQRNIEAICLLATMPQYAISLPNPKASEAIISVLCRMLDIRVNIKDLNEYVKDMDEKMAVIEDKVKDVMTIEQEDPESLPAEKKIPGYIMEKIEKLFKEAKKDKSKAIVLKKELDRWDLYKLYEDRFLDLFKENQ